MISKVISKAVQICQLIFRLPWTTLPSDNWWLICVLKLVALHFWQKIVIMNAYVKLHVNTYNRVREQMTCDVIFVVAILEIVLIYVYGMFISYVTQPF